MDIKAIKEEVQQNTCNFCSKEFKTLKALNRHKKSHIKVKPKTCRLCPEIIFNTSYQYYTHINEFHQGIYTNYFICSACGKQFKTKSELTNHTNSKCGTIKLYKCEVCNQELMTPGSLYNHMLRHKGEPSFMCRFCAKLFLTAGQLKVHERIHTQEKVFVCNICGKGFCHRQSLITHSTLHTGIKPYVCENCGDSFSCVGNLLKHRKTHPDCGLTPLTAHRVKNPVTKMKVKVNTPENSRLKHGQKPKESPNNVTLQQNSQKTQNMSPANENPVTEMTDKTEIFPKDNLETKKSKSAEKFEDNIDYKFEKEFQNNSDDSNNLEDPVCELNENSSETISPDVLISDPKSAGEIQENNDADHKYEKDFRNSSDDSNNVEDPACELNKKSGETIPPNEPMSVNLKKAKHKQHPLRFKITKQELQAFVTERGIQYGEGIKCKFCEKIYCEPRWLLRHEKEFHGSSNICDKSLKSTTVEDLTIQSDNSETFKCSCCKESFIDRNQCRNHQINVHADLLIYSSTARTPLSQRTFTREDSYVVPPEYTNYNEPSYIQAEPYEPIPNRRTVIYDPSLLCNKDITIPLEKNQVEIKKGRPGLPLVQPVLGFCSSAKCGREHLKSIKYALVKISEFIGFSTYEIMKPYKEKPKNVPTCIAEIFVTSPVKKREDSYIVTRAVSLQKQISEDHSPCVPETSDYVRARSNHIRESSGHVREPSSHVREPSSHVREPSSHFRQPSSHIREPSSHIRGPSSHIRQPSSHIRQPSSHIREPSVHIREPSSHIREPSSHIREPSSHIREPSSHIREPSSHIREPSSHFREPSSHIREPSSQIREPSSHVRQPSSHIREPSSHIREPSSHVREPSFSIREPSSHVREPSYTIREPSSHIRHPSSHIREPSSHIREPSSHIREPSSHVREPSCSIREPSSHVCEASSSIREPSCPIREPSSHVRELSSHIRESISSFREPSDLIREPSCPIRELSSHDPDPSSYVRESSGRIRVPSGYVHESSRIRQDDSLRIIRSTEPLAQSNFGVSSQCKTPLSQQSVQLSHTTQKISASKPLLASYTGVEACVCEQDHVQPIVTQTTLQESVVYQDPHSREFSTVGSKQPSRQVSIVHEEPPSCSRCVTMDVKEETSQQPICSRELSTVASRQPSRQVSIIHKEVPSCCRGVVMDVKEETSQHPIYSEELSTVVSLQPIDTEPSYVQHTSSCECFGRQSQISTPRETSEQLARLSQSQQKESFTQAHSGNTSIVISTEPRMPSCCRQELTESQMQPTLEGSNLPTESVQYKRSTLRTTESGRIYNKSTHFQEH